MNLSSKNQVVLILSDWHANCLKLKNILKKQEYDICVDLGDEFDSFVYDSDEDVIKTCELRNEMLSNKNCVCLFGNHTISYLYPSNYTCCSGWEERKQKLIDKHIDKNLARNFYWYCWVDELLVTHAGLHPSHLPPHAKINKEWLTSWLDDQCVRASYCLISDQPHWFYGAGRARGGYQRVGGPLWLDWGKEFQPIEGLFQIVGHSRGENVRIKGGNCCIDTELAQWVTIANGKAEIKKYLDL